MEKEWKISHGKLVELRHLVLPVFHNSTRCSRRITNSSVRLNRSMSMEVKFYSFVTTLACNLAARKLPATVELSSGKAPKALPAAVSHCNK